MRILTRSAFLGSLALFLAACTPQPNLKVPDEYKPGQKAFHRVCSNCHGSDALGKHTKAPRLIDRDFVAESFSNEDLRQTILNGTDKMPAQRKKVTDEEIQEIIKYLRYSQEQADLVVEEDFNPDDMFLEELEEKESPQTG